MLILGVPVIIEGQEVGFNYSILTNAYGFHCIIYGGGKEHRVDYDLNPMWGNMPNEWVKAATAKLIQVLEDQELYGRYVFGEP